MDLYESRAESSTSKTVGVFDRGQRLHSPSVCSVCTTALLRYFRCITQMKWLSKAASSVVTRPRPESWERLEACFAWL
jgi:hypothetical protein